MPKRTVSNTEKQKINRIKFCPLTNYTNTCTCVCNTILYGFVFVYGACTHLYIKKSRAGSNIQAVWLLLNGMLFVYVFNNVKFEMCASYQILWLWRPFLKKCVLVDQNCVSRWLILKKCAQYLCCPTPNNDILICNQACTKQTANQQTKSDLIPFSPKATYTYIHTFPYQTWDTWFWMFVTMSQTFWKVGVAVQTCVGRRGCS